VSSEVVIDADWIAAHLDDPDVRVVEVDVSSAAYDRGHVAGAILWNAYQDLRHPDYTPITPDEFDGLLSRTGVTLRPLWPSTATPRYWAVGYWTGTVTSGLGSWLVRGSAGRGLATPGAPTCPSRA
jgi:hypothetical protein